jgi:predicted permease
MSLRILSNTFNINDNNEVNTVKINDGVRQIKFINLILYTIGLQCIKQILLK